MGQFRLLESDLDMEEGIFIELLEDENKWKYFYVKGASIIARRTALRVANGISKTGYVHPNTKIRCGINCELNEEISPYEDLPKDLKKVQRIWYKGEYGEY
ncbi:MAG: hypothetical protein ACFFHD_05045 [Promethearchaeota archaeon]